MKLGKVTTEIVICPNCDNIQEETVREGDKFAWECRSCKMHIENNKAFLSFIKDVLWR